MWSAPTHSASKGWSSFDLLKWRRSLFYQSFSKEVGAKFMALLQEDSYSKTVLGYCLFHHTTFHNKRWHEMHYSVMKRTQETWCLGKSWGMQICCWQICLPFTSLKSPEVTNLNLVNHDKEIFNKGRETTPCMPSKTLPSVPLIFPLHVSLVFILQIHKLIVWRLRSLANISTSDMTWI